MNIDELLDRLDAAVSGRPRGGDTIRTIALHLESEADTPERKEVVRSLKNPRAQGTLITKSIGNRAVVAFSSGMYNVVQNG